jgi:Lrp/AsnC ligand binding domain
VDHVLDAYILIQTELTETAFVAGRVQTVPGVLETEIVTGPYDLIARAQAHDLDKLAERVTSQIQALPGVLRTVTCAAVQPSRRPTRVRQHRWATNGSLAKLRRGRVNGRVTAGRNHGNSTARDYWDESAELAYVGAAVGKKRQDDPAHRWYRLPSLESFKAGCSCGWVSAERGTFDEMSHDVDQHLDATRQPRTAPHRGTQSQ